MTDRRFYCRYGYPPMHAFVHTDEAKPRVQATLIRCVEIPPKYWGFSLDQAIAFFEKDEKPRMRVRLMDRPMEVDLE